MTNPESGSIGGLVDSRARQAIETVFDKTFFVEAGAGSGKTSSLVSRMVNMVRSGEYEISELAAITFTEKAAEELRTRVREKLSHALTEGLSSEETARLRLGIVQVDAAAIGTLHGFAQRILTTYAAEAGLPPVLTVLDAAATEIEFTSSWDEYLEALDNNSSLAPAFERLAAFGVEARLWRSLAAELQSRSSLFLTGALRLADIALTQDVVMRLRNLSSELASVLRSVLDSLIGPDSDGLCREIRSLLEELERCSKFEDNEEAYGYLSRTLGVKAKSYRRTGSKANWRGDINEARSILLESVGRIRELAATVLEEAVVELSRSILNHQQRAAQQRRRDGTLTFDDLLVLVVALVRDVPEVCAALRLEYRCLFLDEFQDTDPLQAELALRIGGATLFNDVDQNSSPQGGRVFFVGDPKQSIYRFRGADLSLYYQAHNAVLEMDAQTVELTSNFRSTRAIIDFNNRVFRAAFDGLPTPLAGSRVLFRELESTVGDFEGGPPVLVIGKEELPYGTTGYQAKCKEAEEIAGLVTRDIFGETPWRVRDEHGELREARLSDIAILVPTRGSVTEITSAFRREGIAYRSGRTSSVFDSLSVKELLVTLFAVDDPTDSISVVSALRSSIFGCSDVEIATYAKSGGEWDFTQPRSHLEAPPERVMDALSYFEALWRDDRSRAPSQLLLKIIRDRRVVELASYLPRFREELAALRYLLAQARGWSDTKGVGSLRGYLNFVEERLSQDARASEADIPESDDDALAVMTVHASKGLEFPIVIVAGQSHKVSAHGRSGVRLGITPQSEVCFSVAGFKLRGFMEHAEQEQDEDRSELLRLGYVAYTRARDHLVVSVTRVAKKDPAVITESPKTYAELLAPYVLGVQDIPESKKVGSQSSLRSTSGGTFPQLISYNEWAARHQNAIARSRRITSYGVTSLTHDGSVGSIRSDDSGERYGETQAEGDLARGTGVGNAVHRALRYVDFESDISVASAVTYACQEERLVGESDLVEKLVRNVLASPLIQMASQSKYYKEVFVASPLPSGALLEGYIDLLIESTDGLILVDYKTSLAGSFAAATSNGAAMQRYGLQASAYSWALERSAGLRVSRAILFFVGRDFANEYELDHLENRVENFAQFLKIAEPQ